MFGETIEPQLQAAFARLDACDAYVVLVVDPQTQELDARGPYEGLIATEEAARLREEFDRDGLADVQVAVVRLHLTTGQSATAPAPVLRGS